MRSSNSEFNVIGTTNLASVFKARVKSKQSRRGAKVAISKYCDVVAIRDGGHVRTEFHGQRSASIAADCRHAGFSEASFAAVPSSDANAALTASEWGSVEALAGRVVSRAMELVDVVALEVATKADCIDSRWSPMVFGGRTRTALSDQEPGDLLAWLLDAQGGDSLPKLLALCTSATQVMQKQPVVSEVPVPAAVFGDIHGQLRDMLIFFHYYGRPGRGVSFVFNGDFVDRGRHQLEVATILFALKVLYPNLIWLNRGNHEDVNQNRKTTAKGGCGFDQACELALGSQGSEAFASFQSTFEWLPLAARIGKKVLVLHGGLGNGDWTLDMLRAVERPLTTKDLTSALGGAVYNLLWSDPLQADPVFPQQTFGVHQSPRGKHSTIMKAFGRDVTERFCVQEKLGLIIRSHQFRSSGEGYELMHDGWLLRVFSARNYLGKHTNAGGIIQIGHAEDGATLLVRPQVVEQLRRSDAELGKEWPPPRPYCPDLHLMQLVSRPNHAVECGPSIFGDKRRQPEPVYCSRCSADRYSADSMGCYFHCHGCVAYDICLSCAESLALPTRDVIEDDSDSSDDSGDSGRFEEECGSSRPDASILDEGPRGQYPTLLQNALSCPDAHANMFGQKQ
jgi:diadenosine tetraphosphatase ApaH/serine/threonine PP2A family protein phosphatase